MTFVDTHTHPYLDEFTNPAGEIDLAVESGVAMMILPNVDATTVEPMKALHAARPDNTRIAMGLHPTEVTDDDVASQLEFVETQLAVTPGIVAIGEVGVDLYWDKMHREHQMQAFDRQIAMAVKHSLPVIIHCREALDETLEVIAGHTIKPQLIFHSFGGTADDVARIRRTCDPMFGINGIVTFKNSKLRDTLPEITLNRMLLETDAPYLAPVPHRGKTNRPAYIPHIAAHIAASMNVDLATVAASTTANAASTFTLPLGN